MNAKDFGSSTKVWAHAGFKLERAPCKRFTHCTGLDESVPVRSRQLIIVAVRRKPSVDDSRVPHVDGMSFVHLVRQLADDVRRRADRATQHRMIVPEHCHRQLDVEHNVADARGA